MRRRIGGRWLMTVCLWSWAAVATGQPADCQTWQDCRDQTESALASGAAERAHDLAWRAVQRGPRDDAALMFLLARAQSASGRPGDALVMVRRLAERGVVTEAESHPDLERMRGLAGWADLRSRLLAAAAGEPAPAADRTAPASRPAAAPAASPVPSAAPAPAASPTVPAPRTAPPPVEPSPPAPPPTAVGRTAAAAMTEATAPVDERLRFAVEAFEASAVVYDAVSRRFLFGDRFGRKVRVVGEGLGTAVDLVRAESAGFLDVRALDIDRRRGDLWIASAAADGSAGKVHRIQLVSGRPLQSFEASASPEAWQPVDLVVTDGGAVIVLDRSGRLFRVRLGGQEIEAVMDLALPGATGVALGTARDIVYVAHRDGMQRVDLAARTATPVTAPPDVRLAGFERLRAHRGGLAGVWRDAAGARRPVTLTLGPRGRSVTRGVAYQPIDTPDDRVLAMTVIEDDMVLVAPSEGGPPAEVRVSYFRLQ
jgi:hypothetical protein